jgi:hypothetical protein
MCPTALHKLFVLTRRLNVAWVRNLVLAFQDEVSVCMVQLQAAIPAGLSDPSAWDRRLAPKRRSPNYPPQPRDSPKNKDAYSVAAYA